MANERMWMVVDGQSIMTTPPIIEPMTEAQVLSGEPVQPDRPPSFVPYRRTPWYQAHPGTAATLAIALAAGTVHLTGGVWDMFTSAERAERQRLIDEGDRKEAKARVEGEDHLKKLIRANGKATADNGTAIRAMGIHALETARYNRIVFRSLAGQDPLDLELPGPLRDAESVLRNLKSPP